MPKSKSAMAASRRPTPYSELNAILERLVDGSREALGDNFVGAYLHGSFALGDADEHSDVDFIAITREDLSADQLAALQALHAELYRLPRPPQNCCTSKLRVLLRRGSAAVRTLIRPLQHGRFFGRVVPAPCLE